MPLSDHEDVVRSAPYAAPPSRLGVINQSRFWNPGVGMGSINPSDVESRGQMFNNMTKVKSHMARLEARAAELQINQQRDLLALKEEQMRESSEIENRKIDMATEETLLDQVSRGAAGLKAVGRAVSNLGTKIGDKGEEEYKEGLLGSVAEAVDKLPLVGKTKDSVVANKVFNDFIESGKRRDKIMQVTVRNQIDMMSDLVRTVNELKTAVSDQLGADEIDQIFSGADGVQDLVDVYNQFISAGLIPSSSGYVTEGEEIE